MHRILYFSILGLLFFGLLVKNIDSPYQRIYQYLVILVFGLSFFLLFIIKKFSTVELDSNNIFKIQKATFTIWNISILIILYGITVSAYYNYDLRSSLLYPLRILPLALFPVFRYAFPRERDWLNLLFCMVIVGTLSAIIDIASFSIMPIGYSRLMSMEYMSIDYFYALLIAILLLAFYTLNFTARLLLIGCLPPLLYRNFLAVSRGQILILFVLFLYIAYVYMRFTKAKKVVMMVTFGIAGLVIWGSYSILIQDETVRLYMKQYEYRLEFRDQPFEMRMDELTSSIKYGGLAGSGWGAVGNFSHVGRTIPYRDYTHNFVGFLIWKLGLIIGGGMVIIFLRFIYSNSKLNLLLNDRLGFVITGLLVAWVMHCSVNMYFLNTQLNIFLAAWIGYFYKRSFYEQIRVEKMGSI